jgi:hypothetical protein
VSVEAAAAVTAEQQDGGGGLFSSLGGVESGREGVVAIHRTSGDECVGEWVGVGRIWWSRRLVCVSGESGGEQCTEVEGATAHSTSWTDRK